MALPRLVITGASGFIGRRLLDAFKDEYEIIGVARRSQERCGAPQHENISWLQVDIADQQQNAKAFRAIRDTGGADAVIHLAAHYDFTGEEHPEYWRTNVNGLRNVLDECAELELRRFVFASSVAACQFPTPGEALTEASEPDGDHVYAVTKRIGEEMLAEYDDRVPSCIVRFAALFSDWCEYAPLYFFLETWLSKAWNSSILGGRGGSAIPYLHVRDGAVFMHRLLEQMDDLNQREVLVASPDGAVTHRELFDMATLTELGHRRRPMLMPGPLCVVGVWARDLAGRVLGNRPFERPWMVRYIDDSLTVDSRRTRERLAWMPRKRLGVERRMLFMLENRKRNPVDWQQKNQAAMKEVQFRSNLLIHRLLEVHQDEIRQRFTRCLLEPGSSDRFPNYQTVARGILGWRHTVILRHLMNAVRTADKGVFTDYCRDLAARRHDEGFHVLEVLGAMEVLNSTCLERLREDPEAEGLTDALRDYLTMTVQFGCDQIVETFESLDGDLHDFDLGLGAPMFLDYPAVEDKGDQSHTSIENGGDGHSPGDGVE
ncbi:MAG: NAD(P)-dependent oxidoreductase [bacterium]|nr:NAD(P)-dependent oxidoreductase [bacterium]